MELEAYKLTAQFDFTTQLCMVFQAPNWYVAGLDATTVKALENKRKGMPLAKYTMSLIAGRASTELSTAKKVFVADTPFITRGYGSHPAPS